MTERELMTGFEAAIARRLGTYADVPLRKLDANVAAALERPVPRQRSRLGLTRPTSAYSRWAAIGLVALVTAAVVASALLLVGHLRPVEAPMPPVFEPLGLMHAADNPQPILVTLADGRVLIAGGGVEALRQPIAEVFDAQTGTSSTINGEGPRGTGSGMLLQDGSVLVIGYDSSGPSSAAYLLDPGASEFRLLPQPGTGSSPPFGVLPTLVALSDGRALVLGGQVDAYKHDLSARVMVFDPQTAAFTPAGSMLEPRQLHSATRLPDGRVLIAGGNTVFLGQLGDGSTAVIQVATGTAEVYDPASGLSVGVGSMGSIQGANLGQLLADGTVLIVPADYVDPRFSLGHPSYGRSPKNGEIFNPTTGTFSAGPTLPGLVATMNLLPDGRLLLTGERVHGVQTEQAWLPWAAVYDGSDGSLTMGPTPAAYRALAVAIPNRGVLFAGGLAWDGSSVSVEISREIGLVH